MQFTVHAVARPLSPYVRLIWTLTGAGDGAAHEPIVPDGCVELVLNCGDPFEQAIDDTARLQPRAMLVTEVRRPVVVRPTGRVDLLGVRFQPAGARAFLSMPMSAVIDRAAPLDELLEPSFRAALSACFGIAEVSDRVRRVTDALVQRLASGRRYDALIGRVVRVLEEDDGTTDVASLARAASLTTRQLERRFDDAVGVSPKALASVLRFQRVLRAVRQETPAWRHIAAACGYYDQAHLIRDFKRYTLETPRVFAATARPLAENFRPAT